MNVTRQLRKTVNFRCRLHDGPFSIKLQSTISRKVRDFVKTLYLIHECTNRYLSSITNAEINIRINESFPERILDRESEINYTNANPRITILLAALSEICGASL